MSEREVPLQPLMSTLLLGGKTADEYCADGVGSGYGVRWTPHPNMPPRRRISIEEFERDMADARNATTSPTNLRNG